MENYAVRIKGLGKRFVKTEGPRSLFRSLFQSSEKDYFWALRNVSIDIKNGESFGLIGPNGAGKSTLLKIVSRIFMPTEGEIELYGRVNSLLEVGTGFESELSGRKNVYLNASILGMSPKEIDSVYEEIVEFSGLRDFMDMPVKHYSSGMYARLAFSVAAYVTGDILAVDEVLSVGDAEFRRKSMGRMEDMMAAGDRTIIFVSHSTDAISRFCDRAAWIHKGQIREMGSADEVVRSYVSATNQKRSLHVVGSVATTAPARGAGTDGVPATPTPTNQTLSYPSQITYLNQRDDNPDSDAAARIDRVALVDEKGVPRDVVFRDQPQIVEIGFRIIKGSAPPISCYIAISCAPRKGLSQETTVFSTFAEGQRFRPGDYTARVAIPANLLTSAQYNILVGLRTVGDPVISHDTVKSAIQFRVIDRDPRHEVGAELLRGVVHPALSWSIEPDLSLGAPKAV